MCLLNFTYISIVLISNILLNYFNLIHFFMCFLIIFPAEAGATSLYRSIHLFIIRCVATYLSVLILLTVLHYFQTQLDSFIFGFL